LGIHHLRFAIHHPQYALLPHFHLPPFLAAFTIAKFEFSPATSQNSLNQRFNSSVLLGTETAQDAFHTPPANIVTASVSPNHPADLNLTASPRHPRH